MNEGLSTGRKTTLSPLSLITSRLILFPKVMSREQMRKAAQAKGGLTSRCTLLESMEDRLF